jgi:hypothetical protein
MKELAIQIMNVCRGHKVDDVYRALEFVRAWAQTEAAIPLEGIKNPARDMTTGMIVEAYTEPCPKVQSS